ncbi:MAG: helix-turn-helix transcriptional regulator [Steroidobacteraceae bacterium]
MSTHESQSHIPETQNALPASLAPWGSERLPLPAFLRIRDVLRITSLSRPTLYRRIAERRFPPPVHLGGRACGWSVVALQTWINDPEGYREPDTPDTDAPCRRGRPRKYPL